MKVGWSYWLAEKSLNITTKASTKLPLYFTMAVHLKNNVW